MPQQNDPDAPNQNNLPPRGESQGDDSRDSVTHGRQSHIVNERAEKDARRDHADTDPVMPTGDSTLKTDI